MLLAGAPFQPVDCAHGRWEDGAGELEIEMEQRAEDVRDGWEEHSVCELAGLGRRREPVAVNHIIDVAAQVLRTCGHVAGRESEQARDGF